MSTESDAFPLYVRYPDLRRIPRAVLCALPSPVQQLNGIGASGDLWIKRDDLNAPGCGGNKARALEFLLGDVRRGDTVLTVGGAGSTHILATATHAYRLGASMVALRWEHDMNPVAELVAGRIAQLVPGARVARSSLLTIARARLRHATSDVKYIPIGGGTPLGALGHVNAALELAKQIEAGDLPLPEAVVVPFGTGGTIAGLSLGFAIAGIRVRIIGARVGPRLFVNQTRALGLARRTARLIERVTGQAVPTVDPDRLTVVHHVFGGAYGRPLAAGDDAAAILQAHTGLVLDSTYSAKAFAAALDEAKVARGPILFWLTFDARCLTS
ncbi:MAG TPA: pyridoxal-phosphate dependent enzyme [Gemmatimonadaceae bacterium]|nr:pyridoxal-phosphate dependent enzyme [Gemmatimonadaceae bacterium]